MPGSTTVIDNPARLAAARRARSLDEGSRGILQRLVELAAELAEAPVALLTVVEQREQIFLAQCGLPQELAASGGTPIEFSVCQHAVAMGRPLIIDHMAADPEWRDHPAVSALGLGAYAGIPVVDSDGLTLGTLCVIDRIRRDWTDEILARLALLADVISDEIDLAAHRRKEQFEQVWKAIPEYHRH